MGSYYEKGNILLFLCKIILKGLWHLNAKFLSKSNLDLISIYRVVLNIFIFSDTKKVSYH